MIKKFSSYLGVFVLICFSFYYTDKAVDIVKRNDPVMQSILQIVDEYKVDPVNALMDGEDVIPGYNGKRVNIDESYRNMKRLNEFHESMLVFEEIVPNTNVQKAYDKYIVKGNPNREEVALIVKVDTMTNLLQIQNILLEKNIVVTFFIDGTVVENNMDFIYDLAKDGNEIENFGYDGSYTKDKIEWTNNMIESITNSQPKYCYTEYNDGDLLKLCKEQKMYTVKPTIFATNYPFSTVKRSLDKGSIITLTTAERVIKELPAIISYIEQKGYKVVTLSQIISENRIDEK